jgi:2-octaprenyl-6-methoxyphenol hydroxylase
MQFDVVIVGGGMVGASLALALRGLALDVLLVEAHAPDSVAQPSFDERTTALGNGTRRIFEALGVWEAMRGAAAPIRCIHVSERGGFGFARLVAAEQGIEAFGYVVANRVIGRTLWEALRRPQAVARGSLELRAPATVGALEVAADRIWLSVEPAAAGAPPERVGARLVVAADGAQSMLRGQAGIGAEVEDYGQTAIIANIGTEPANDGTAYERFTSSGPLAVLPLHDGSYTVIWTLAPELAAQTLRLGDTEFLAALQGAFGWRVGRLRRVGRRVAYPLLLTRADDTAANRVLLIGNASQALHPVAGQGFNLGLRDAATLAEVLAEALAETLAVPSGGVGEPPDVGDPALLASFCARRAADRRGVTRFTDGLIKLFGDERPGFGVARNLGLLLFDLAPPAKRALSRLSSGFSGRTPRLARGLSLP